MSRRTREASEADLGDFSDFSETQHLAPRHLLGRLLAHASVAVVRGHGREVALATVLAFDCSTDAVLGAQVEDEVGLAGARVRARTEAADELQQETTGVRNRLNEVRYIYGTTCRVLELSKNYRKHQLQENNKT